MIAFPWTLHHDTEPYAWSWAATTLLDRHPRYRQRFRQLDQFVNRDDFNEQFFRLFDPDWQELCEEWQLMVANLEYGYDVALGGRFHSRYNLPSSARGRGRHAISPRPLAGEGRGVRVAGPADSVTIAADRGWQSSGLRLQAGLKYRLTATGRYQVAKGDNPVGQTFLSAAGQARMPAPLLHNQPKIWWCEPNGVSIRYYHGRPLGLLLAAVRPDHPGPDRTSALLHPTVVGLGTTLLPTETGTLFLKVNDSAGELADNAGELKVKVRRE